MDHRRHIRRKIYRRLLPDRRQMVLETAQRNHRLRADRDRRSFYDTSALHEVSNRRERLFLWRM